MAIIFSNGYPVVPWDIARKLPAFVPFGKDGETGRGFKIKLMQNQAVITPTTETMRLYAEKPDGTHVYIDGVKDGDTFRFDLTTQIFAVIGTVKAHLELNSGVKTIFSDDFSILVDANLVDASIESSNEYMALIAALNSIDAKANQSDIDAILKSEPVGMNTAVGDSAGVAITTGTRNTALGSFAGNSITSGMGNSLVGSYAGQMILAGIMNTLMGHGAGRSITTGGENTGIGYQSQHEVVGGNENVALGHQALYYNVNGNGNVAIGHEAGFNQLGNHLVAIGMDAGRAHTTGIQDTLIGTQAGLALTNEGTNTLVGYQAGVSATSPANTAVGANALVQLTTGERNTAVGKNAGFAITTGAANTMLGEGTDVLNPIFYRATAIGSGAKVDASDTMQLGDVNLIAVKTPATFESTGIGAGFILKSPNGTRYRIVVSDGGVLSAVLA